MAAGGDAAHLQLEGATAGPRLDLVVGLATGRLRCFPHEQRLEGERGGVDVEGGAADGGRERGEGKELGVVKQ